MAAANRQDETTPCRNRCPSLICDDRGSLAGDGLSIGKDLYSHKGISILE
jgi:hypothetical protein